MPTPLNAYLAGQVVLWRSRAALYRETGRVALAFWCERQAEDYRALMGTNGVGVGLGR